VTIRVAAKLLSLVEVSAEASNQHEFNAGLLRKALHLPESRTAGRLDITYVTDDYADAEGESCRYTMSNVRLDNPHRDEYHMYYSSRRLQQLARAGDILVLTRSGDSTDLRALIVRTATELAAQVQGLLADDGVEVTSRFKAISARVRGSAAATFFGAAAESSTIPSAEDFLKFAQKDFVKRALASGNIPSGKLMATEAGTMVDRMEMRPLDADLFLQWRLDAETTLFQHLENTIGQRELDALNRLGSLDFGDVAKLVLKRLQARRSRRGQSLQNHLAALLDLERIPYKEQCRTEHGERPDFIVPGCDQYRDAAFPAARLRMIACKSILRERWDQMLNEAARIPEKYLLTLDLGITDATIADVRRNEIRLFIPAPVCEAAYRHHVNRREIESVADLVKRLRKSQK
jgi:EcoRII C terminal